MSKPIRTDFFAGSTERTDNADWQALAQIKGLLHDLGKYTEVFQMRLEKRGIKK